MSGRNQEVRFSFASEGSHPGNRGHCFSRATRELRLRSSYFQRVPSRKEEIAKNVHKRLKGNCGLTCPCGRLWKAQNNGFTFACKPPLGAHERDRAEACRTQGKPHCCWGTGGRQPLSTWGREAVEGLPTFPVSFPPLLPAPTWPGKRLSCLLSSKLLDSVLRSHNVLWFLPSLLGF